MEDSLITEGNGR